jgi:hypothetical protein
MSQLPFSTWPHGDWHVFHVLVNCFSGEKFGLLLWYANLQFWYVPQSFLLAPMSFSLAPPSFVLAPPSFVLVLQQMAAVNFVHFIL